MLPARRSARASTSASGGSPPVTLAAATKSATTSNGTPRHPRRSALAAAPRVLQGASPSKLHADTSYDDPIVLSDTDTDAADGTKPANDSDQDMTPLPDSTAATNGVIHSLSLLSPASVGKIHDESRSSTTVDQSYATSLNSEPNVLSDGSLSSLSSADSDSDAADTADDKSDAAVGSPRRTPRLRRTKTLASTPLQDLETTPEATARSSSSTPTPSRRSARIVSSGSSVQKALQRRDELDAKMLAGPVRRKPESPEVPPPKRPVGRPRKSAPPVVPVQSSNARLAPLQAAATPSVRLMPSSSSARRSTRLSLPSHLVADSQRQKSTAVPSAQADESFPREPRRGTRSRGSEILTDAKDESKPLLTASASSMTIASSAVLPGPAVPKANSGSLAAAPSVPPTPPIKRGPGRPRKVQSIVPTPSPAPATPATQPKDLAPVTRLGKRSLSLAGISAKSESPALAEKQEEQETPRRKRGRPARAVINASEEPAGSSLASSPAPSSHAHVNARNHAIDLLDDDLSELSDASDMSIDSSQPSRSASLSAPPGERRRGRPSSASTMLSRKLKRASKQDKDGKAYHFTGLYAGEADAVASTSSVRPAAAESILLPHPIHFGAKLLTEERDFCLPYPIHQSMDQLRERVNAKRKPPRYQQISRNKYVSRPKLQGEVPLCNCEPGSGCGERCMNRLLQFICDPKTCPSASNCTNTSLGRRNNVKTTVAYYGRRGFGLKTLEAIGKDDFIDEYRGEVINLSEAAKRVTEEYKATGNYYLLDYDSAAGELLDGGRKGNITRFANHSCDPNCRIEKFIICGTDEALSAEFQIGLFALRDIAAGEELTYNYGWSAFQPRDITGAPTEEVPIEQCLCGAANCSGILGGKKAPVSKAAADVLTANSRKKTAKGQGKGKGKIRKSTQSSRARMRAMTPMLNAARLSAAAMPSSALLSAKAARSSRQREEAQSSLTLLNKIVTKRRERSEREAENVAALASASIAEHRPDPVIASTTNSASRSRVAATAKAKEAAAALQALASHSTPAVDSTMGQASAVPAETSSPKEGGSTSQPASSNGQTDAPSSATSRIFPRLPLLKRIANKRLGGGFGRAATAARGTKDRRWSAAEALMADADGSSSPQSESAGTQEQDEDAQRQSKPKKTGRRGRHKLQLSDDEAARRAVERRARNAFLARVRRASKRGIVIEDPTQHPLKKISIQCTAAPENTYIPDLPSSLVTLGMTTADARRARNAFLARVRRAMKRGFAKDVAIKMAAKPLPGDPNRDTPVMKAQRAYMEQLEQQAADELTASMAGDAGNGNVGTSSSNAAAAAADDEWKDESGWIAAQ